MIKNDEMFKMLFYYWYFLKCHDFGYHEAIEKDLKDYLLRKGYKDFRDLDYLYLYFIKEGRI